MNEDQIREILAQEYEAVAPLKTATAAAIRLDQYGSMSDIPYRVAMAALRRTRDWTAKECAEATESAVHSINAKAEN